MRADASWSGRQELKAGIGRPRPEAAPSTPASSTGAPSTAGQWAPGQGRRRFGSLFAERESVGLRCDLWQPAAPAATERHATVLEIDARELGELLAETAGRRQASSAAACPIRRRLIRRRIGRCFVAMTRRAEPCFVQWLLTHTDNQALRHAFGDVFPHLLRDEALLEGAFTPAPFDAAEIAPTAMARIAARAEPLGVRWVHHFVPVDQPDMIRATVAAGFAPHQRRVQRRGLWRWSTSFGPLPDGWQLHQG